MNRRFFFVWAVAFVVWMVGTFVVHGVLLHADYEQLPTLFRPESDAQKYFPLLVLAHAVMSGALVWVYARGAQAKPWLGQGLRFGLVIALLTVVPTHTINYVGQPVAGVYVIKQIVFDGILLGILGAVIAFAYRLHART